MGDCKAAAFSSDVGDHLSASTNLADWACLKVETNAVLFGMVVEVEVHGKGLAKLYIHGADTLATTTALRCCDKCKPRLGLGQTHLQEYAQVLPQGPTQAGPAE